MVFIQEIIKDFIQEIIKDKAYVVNLDENKSIEIH